jgi:hypothetical protein
VDKVQKPSKAKGFIYMYSLHPSELWHTSTSSSRLHAIHSKSLSFAVPGHFAIWSDCALETAIFNERVIGKPIALQQLATPDGEFKYIICFAWLLKEKNVVNTNFGKL